MMNKKDKIKNLEKTNELYKQFILATHGPEALKRLEAEYAILKTNETLEQYSKDEAQDKIKHLAEYR